MPIIGNTLQVKPILKAVVSKSPKDMGVPISQHEVVHTGRIDPNGLAGSGITVV